MVQRTRRKGSTPARATPAAPARYEVTVSARRLPRALLFAALGLLACHAALQIIHYRVTEVHWLLLQMFDVNQENNLPTWFSGFLLLLASGLLWLSASQTKMDRKPWSGHWFALAVGFLLLSVDEIAGVHESINSVIVMTWAIPGGIAALMIGLVFIPFLLALPRRTAQLFAAAGALYLAGGAGLEIFGNALVGRRLKDTLQYGMQTLAEEGLEMLGVILFLYALLNYMRGNRPGSVQASVVVG